MKKKTDRKFNLKKSTIMPLNTSRTLEVKGGSVVVIKPPVSPVPPVSTGCL